MSLVVAALEHHARRLVNVVTHALAEKASGFSHREAGDYLDEPPLPPTVAAGEWVDPWTEESIGAWGEGHGLGDDCSLMTSAGTPPPAVEEGPAAGGPDTPAAGALDKHPLPWSVADGTDDWWLKGAFPGLVLDAWGVVIGRFDTMAQAELVVAAVNVSAPKPPGVLTWEGWAVPAILDVLAAHRVHEDDEFNVLRCRAVWSAHHHARFSTWAEWRNHVAPLIADRIACDPARAAAALASHTPK